MFVKITATVDLWVRAALLASACVLSVSPAQAQSKATPDEEINEVVVTGTRLGNTGATTPTPVTVVDAKLLENLNVTNVGSMISSLPAFKASNNANTNGFGSFNVGAELVNLRGLGVNRSLVLLDGRRVATETREATVDLNFIPSILVQRMDVVTGGASAAYGSDAVAGVVNVILDHKFDGFKAQLDYGRAQAGDGQNYHVSAALGQDFGGGKGHFIAGLEGNRESEIGACYTARSWCASDALIANTAGATYVAGQPYYVRVPSGAGFWANPNGVISIINNSTAGTAALRNLFGTGAVTFDNTGKPIADTIILPGSGNTTTGGNTIPFQTLGELQVPVNRYTSFFHADYDFNDRVKGFAEFAYGYVYGVTQQAKYYGTTVPIFADNPYMPQQIRTLLNLPAPTLTPASLRPGTTATTGTYGTGAFNVSILGELPGVSGSSADSWHVATGLSGKLGENWKWDAYYQYSNTVRHQSVQNDMVTGGGPIINQPGTGGVNNPASLAYLWWSTDVVLNPQGQPVCRATLSTNPALVAAAAGCQPYNVFGGPSQAALGYVYHTLTERLDIYQHALSINAHGELFQLPAGAASLAGGLEARRDGDDLLHDPLSNTFDYYQNFGHDYNASQNVIEGYLETELPLLKNVPGARSLNFSGGIRDAHYSVKGTGGYLNQASTDSFNALSWKLGMVWEPLDWARFRVTRSQDIRAPNFYDLFQASASSFNPVANPFVTPTVNQYPSGLAGGNPHLTPEVASTWTYGLVIAPQSGWASRLRFSVDYYDIRVNNYITSAGTAATIVQQCFANAASPDCALITFGPNKSLAVVDSTNINATWLRTRGLDYEADYTQPLDEMHASWAGNLSFRLLVTRNLASATNIYGVTTDRVGETGSATGVPSLLANLYTTYANGPFSGTLTTRYIPSGHLNNTYVGPDDPLYDPTKATILEGGIAKNTVSDNMVSSAIYFNLTASYNLSQDGNHKSQVFASINNLMDRVPPSAPGTSPVYFSNPVLFDQIGRYYKVGVRYQF